MYTLYGSNFINMIRSFYPSAKVASGGSEIIIRCKSCGDSSNLTHAHLYISVPQNENEISMYHCKKCSNKGIIDDTFLRQYGCEDTRVLVDIIKHNDDLSKHPKYQYLKQLPIYPLKNTYVSNNGWNSKKIDYINNRIGSNFNIEDLMRLKIFLNLYDIIQSNGLGITRHELITNALNEHFVGFISYDNSYAIMRKIDNAELYKTVNKRYINYNIVDKLDSSKDFYVIPTRVDVSSIDKINIHIAEGVFDILSIWYNLNNMNSIQNIYISCSGKSYSQALSFILKETGIINYEIHIYPDNDVSEYELNRLLLSKCGTINSDIIIHRNMYNNEKDYGVTKDRIIDITKLIPQRRL